MPAPNRIAFAAIAGFVSSASAGDAIPGELLATVSKVHSAAARCDYTALRTSMTREFTWSFGGDGDIEQAVAEWKKEPKYLKALARVTRAKCGWIKRGVFQCPTNAGLAYRAGFEQVEGTWKLAYFVAGD